MSATWPTSAAAVVDTPGREWVDLKGTNVCNLRFVATHTRRSIGDFGLVTDLRRILPQCPLCQFFLAVTVGKVCVKFNTSPRSAARKNQRRVAPAMKSDANDDGVRDAHARTAGFACTP